MGFEQLGIPWLWIVAGLGLLLALTWITVIIIYVRLRRFQKAYLSLQTVISGGNLDSLLKDAIQETRDLGGHLKEVEVRLQKTEGKLRTSFNQTGFIRFNAFDNMGSDLSFAVAFTNQDGDGLVLSSINSREESRVYAKPLTKAESNYPLSSEEREAINKALAGPKL